MKRTTGDKEQAKRSVAVRDVAAHQQHTPGPWAVNGMEIVAATSEPGEPILAGGDFKVATVSRTRLIGVGEANSRLLAASPDLLRACRAALEIVGCYTLGSEDASAKKPVEKLLREAIAKACPGK